MFAHLELMVIENISYKGVLFNTLAINQFYLFVWMKAICPDYFLVCLFNSANQLQSRKSQHQMNELLCVLQNTHSIDWS